MYFQRFVKFKYFCMSHNLFFDVHNFELDYFLSIFPFPRRCHKQERVSLVAQAPLAATDGSMDPRYSFNFTAAAGFEARHNLVLGCRVCSAGAGDSCSEAETPVLVSQVSCSQWS